MKHLLLRCLSLVLFVPLGGGASIRLDRYKRSESSGSPTVSRTVIANKSHRFKIRTVTVGVNLKNTSDLATVESAIEFLQRARKKLEDEGYEIQTLRIATQPLPEYLNGKSRGAALADLKAIDGLGSARNVLISIGPVITDDRHDSEFAVWATLLVKETKNINFSVTVASPERGIHRQTALTAAETIVAISKSSPGGEGNFRFTAAANCLAGTPFFPVAYHQGALAFSIGLESPGLLQEAFRDSKDIEDAKAKLKTLLESELRPVEKLALEIARDDHREYRGIDVSPAPAKDRSIGAAIEAL